MKGSFGTLPLVYWDSGAGIRQDIGVLRRGLEHCGISVSEKVMRRANSRRSRLGFFLRRCGLLLVPVRAQVHVSLLHWEQFHLARNNYVYTNPEKTPLAALRKIRRPFTLLAKSRSGEALFRATGLPTEYTGFTTADHWREGHVKDYRRFLHLAGSSSYKGTHALVKVWRRHPEWPKLTVVRSLTDAFGARRPSLPGAVNIEIIETELPQEQILQLQNTCGIHLCPSEMEGFGHYINEARSTASVVITTDAPPMNELIQPQFGICVAAQCAGHSCLSERWEVVPEALEFAISDVLSMPSQRLAEMGAAARAAYLAEDAAFLGRMQEVFSGCNYSS